MSGPFSTAIVQAGGHNTLDDEQACSCRERMTLSTHPSLHPFIIHIPIYASLHPPTNHPLSTHPPIQLFILSYSHPPTHPPSFHPPTYSATHHPSICIHPSNLHPPIHPSTTSANQVLPRELPTSSPHGPGTGPCTSVVGEGTEDVAETQRLVLALHGLGGVCGQTGVARAHASEVSLCSVPMGMCPAEIQTQG